VVMLMVVLLSTAADRGPQQDHHRGGRHGR
jgi:hypothetical protein